MQILLSKSWCDVNDSMFLGTVSELSSKEIFAEKYFVDPIQMIYTRNITVAMLSLFEKIASSQPIDFVFFIEELEYCCLVELINKRYNIPCFLLVYSAESLIKKMFDPYIRASIPTTLMHFSKIFTYSYLECVFNQIRAKSFSIFPCQETITHRCEIMDEIILFCTIDCKTNINNIHEEQKQYRCQYCFVLLRF